MIPNEDMPGRADISSKQISEDMYDMYDVYDVYYTHLHLQVRGGDDEPEAKRTASPAGFRPRPTPSVSSS